MKRSFPPDQQETSYSSPIHWRPDPPAEGERSETVNVTPGSLPEFSLSTTVVEESEQPWRKYGRARRQWLLDNDKAATSFRMNAACSIQKYFALAERVIEQFQELCDRHAIEDAFVMGHRLIAFLGSALPRHPAYASSTKQRAITEGHLRRIQKQMKDIAILIDEEQLNIYITNDFDPVIEEDDEDEDEKKDEVVNGNSIIDDAHEHTTWEAFAGWSVGCDSPPGGIDTDESSQDIDSDIDFFDFDPNKRMAKSKTKAIEPSVTDPDLDHIASDEEDYDTDDHDDTADPLVIYAKPPVLSTSILRKIAREAVRYESDSEAADSWAQDGNGNASDTTSSEVGLLNSSADVGTGPVQFTSCDPARLAIRALMNKHSRQLQSLQREMDRLLSNDSPPPQPANEDLSMLHESLGDSQDTENDEVSIPSYQENTDIAVRTIPLPPPAISGPYLMDPQFIPAKAPTAIPLPRDDESPTPSQPLCPTPSNSPEDTALHQTNRWGVHLRRTPSQFERKRDLSISEFRSVDVNR